MSYDICLFRPTGSDDLLQQATAILEKGDSAPSAELDQIRLALVEDLKALHPAIQVQNSQKGFSHGCWLESGEVDCGIPYVEIGVSTGFMSGPYFRESNQIFLRFQRVLEIFEKHGYVAYDPQLDEILSASDLSKAQETYNHTSNNTFGPNDKIIII